MAELNLRTVKAEIRDYIKSWYTGIQIAEQAIPDSATLEKDARGLVKPYLAFQFGDLQRVYGGGRGFTGVRKDDHEMPIYFQSVSGEANEASDMADDVISRFLGMQFLNTGEVRKRPGGGMFPIVSSNGATEAYMFPSSFAVTIQLMDL